MQVQSAAIGVQSVLGEHKRKVSTYHLGTEKGEILSNLTTAKLRTIGISYSNCLEQTKPDHMT